jgi:hypothetical protein
MMDKFRMLNIIDEFTHECLAIRVSRRLKSIDVLQRAYPGRMPQCQLVLLAGRCA